MPKISRSHTTPFFEKKFEHLEQHLQKMAARKLLLFENNPSHPSLDTHKLHGDLAQFWAFSVTKKYRVLFRFLKDHEVVYYDIDTHDIYK